MRQVFYGSNRNGKPVIPEKHRMAELLASFDDTPFQITIDKRFKKRSNQQSSYYYGCCVPAVLDGLVNNGYPKSELTLDVVHEFLKGKFLLTELVSEQTGEVISRVKSTTELSTTDFALYIDDIQRWAAEFLGIVIPNPNEQSEMTF